MPWGALWAWQRMCRAFSFRMLNRSKGPAVWSPRAQCDRHVYAAEIRKMLEAEENLFMRADMAVDLLTENGVIRGVITQLGMEIRAKAVILTSGTFMNGQIHIGKRDAWRWSNGRGGIGRIDGRASCSRIRVWPAENGQHPHVSMEGH